MFLSASPKRWVDVPLQPLWVRLRRTWFRLRVIITPSIYFIFRSDDLVAPLQPSALYEFTTPGVTRWLDEPKGVPVWHSTLWRHTGTCLPQPAAHCGGWRGVSLRLCPLLSDSSSLCSLSPLELLCVLPGVLLLRFPCVYCTSDYVPRVGCIGIRPDQCLCPCY